MPSRKTRPPRIYLDKRTKKFYIIQNKVKRFIEESDYEKIAQAVKSGELAYKTTKKGPTWLSKFPEQKAPVNRDMGFLPGELTPIERRKIEKAKWEVYGHAVEQYKKEQEEYSKKLRETKKLEDQKKTLENDKKEIKIQPTEDKKSMNRI